MPNVFQTYDEKDAKTLFCTQNVSFILQTSDYSTVSQKILSKCPQLYWRIKEKKLFNCHRLIVIFSPTLAPLQLGRGEYITMTITLWQSYFLGIRRYSVLDIFWPDCYRFLILSIVSVTWWTEKFIALALVSYKDVSLTSSSFGSVYSFLSKVS